MRERKERVYATVHILSTYARMHMHCYVLSVCTQCIYSYAHVLLCTEDMYSVHILVCTSTVMY